ncbi:MAG: flavodoxin family protein [Spirochaetales bacterium]|nr:flavodoxin family protein [Spirochaetales bacterium]
MNIVAFNGSPTQGGNTEYLLKKVLEVLSEKGLETEFVQLGGKSIKGCRACFKCFANKDKKCSVTDDVANECITKAINADAILIGSPTYFTNVTAETKALIDRLGFVSLANGGLLKRKIGAAIVAVRRGGAIHVFDSINHLFLMTEMIIAGSTYWNFGYGRTPGEAAQDEEGNKNMKNLGENIAWLLDKIGEQKIRD